MYVCLFINNENENITITQEALKRYVFEDTGQ